MNIGGPFQQQMNPLAMAIGQQNLAGLQTQQLTEEQRRKKQDALWAALDQAWSNLNQNKNIGQYFLAGTGGGMGF